MDYHENSRSDIEAGQRVQEKIQFYFLTLAFTVLALAIQTYKPGTYSVSSVAELFSWFLLLVSGILGLYRMHLLPKYYKLSVHMNTLRSNIKDALDLKQKGEMQLYLPEKNKIFEIGMYIEEHQTAIEHFLGEEKALTKHLKPIIRVHELGLIVGIVLLAIARAYGTVIGVCT